MKLTEKDKEDLLAMDVPPEDFRQIADAAQLKYTKYSLYAKGSERGKRISRDDAIRLLGRKEWLSGLSRSAFHFTACRDTLDGASFVLFDSHKLFAD